MSEPTRDFLHATFSVATIHPKCPRCCEGFTVLDFAAVIVDEYNRPLCPDCSGERGRALCAKMDASVHDPSTTTMLANPNHHPSRKKQ